MKKSKLSTFRVLTVDDERMITKIVCDVLMSLGFHDITTATDGYKAIALLSKNKYDFIITDWQMPDMSGIDLVNFIRRAPESIAPTTPIIMLTGNTEAHHVITALEAGVNGYLIKPFSAEQLVRRIRAIIEKPLPFVLSKKYRGPDRRRVSKAPPNNVDRRKSKLKSIL